VPDSTEATCATGTNGDRLTYDGERR